jgi:hypothetical protein
VTAEIAILNRSAVALAADSTVTVTSGHGDRTDVKTYNSVNKLFTLSKYHPVGVMLYGNADLMGVPWETVIKEYRRRLGKASFNSIGEYAADLIRFLETVTEIFPEEIQRDFFSATVASYFLLVQSNILEAVKKASQGPPQRKVKESEINQITNGIIEKHWTDIEASKKCLAYLPADFENGLIVSHVAEVDAAAAKVFGKTRLSSTSRDLLRKIGARVICSEDIFPTTLTGLVVAGYGEKQFFPEVKAFSPHLIISNRLIYKDDADQSYAVSHGGDAALIPFAQKDVVDTILQGIDTRYYSILLSVLNELADKYPRIVETHLAGQSISDKDKILAKIKADADVITQSVHTKINEYRDKEHVSPLLAVIGVLPKDELAAMAEALVGLTSVKRKMSPKIETVGGPIDVAVISKGDGFIWISRKHYFKPEANLHFVQNYLREESP